MHSNPSSAVALRRLARALGLAVSALGFTVLVGWSLAIPPLASLLPGFPPIAASTALGLVALGLALAMLAPARASPRAIRSAQGLVLATVVLMGLSIAGRVSGGGLGLDAVLQPASPPAAPAAGASAGSALALLLIGLALLLRDLETRFGHRPAQILALGAALIPLQALIGSWYGIEAARGQQFTRVGLPSAVAFSLLCAGTLLARPERGFIRVFTSRGPAGRMARRLLSATILLPIVLGWLFLVAGLRAGQYQAMVATSVLVVCAVVTGSVVVWWNAREIQLMDEGRSAVEEALRGEREWFRTTLSSIGDAVIAADDSGEITDVNPMAEVLTGCAARDALGQPIETIFRVRGPLLDEPVESPFERIFREDRIAELPRETVMVSRSGEEFPVEGCAAPIHDRRGHARGVVLVFRDIRERRRVEEERANLLARERAARAEAEEASRAKDEFIATLSHELRTPLNSVLGWARLLRIGKLDALAMRRAVEAIERGATTQAQIVDDLLDMARIVRGQLKLDVRPIELSPVLEAAMDAVRPAAAAREIQIAAVMEPRAGLVVGDPGRLQQVAWNLLSNAIKFTPPGGRVEVGLTRRGDHVELVVSDTGAGISAEFLPHAFERFRQADSSSTRAHGGLGLGLSIVRHLVEAHGGTVSAESAGLGLGSTFRVALPHSQSRPRPREPELPSQPPRVAAPPPPAVPLDELRILVVDDDVDTLEVVKQLLEHAGARVTTAASAPEALEALRHAPPDVLLSDLGMPGQDGCDLIRQVRLLEPERGGSVPAAALTAFTQAEYRQQALAAGYQLYLAKPIEPSELTAAVARLAGRWDAANG